MAGGSGSRVRWVRARRSRSRSRCVVANELILLVEDNEKNWRLMRDVLAFKGYRLAEAETGEDGVRLAGELHPDLILRHLYARRTAYRFPKKPWQAPDPRRCERPHPSRRNHVMARYEKPG